MEGPTGATNVSIRDVNKDNHPDLIVEFVLAKIDNQPTKMILGGRTDGGTVIQGSACVQASGAPCGGTNLGEVNKPQSGNGASPAGPNGVACSEDFDGVTAPALPANWVAATATDCVNSNPWETSAAGTPAPPADTAPNAAFVNDPNCISDERLDSPSFLIVSTTAALTFRQNRNLENGFDGTVLEVSINGGAFQDILATGATFGTFGYNGTISVNFGSPIAGRQAWTGSSGGVFVTTTVNLPASANGQSWVFRWRRATDSSVSGLGFRLDGVALAGSDCSGAACTITCPANVTQGNDLNQCGAVVNYPPPTPSGTCGTITCAPASGSFFPVGTTTVTCAAVGSPASPAGQCANPATITHSSSQAITPLNSISCNDGFAHTDNHYWRAFSLLSFGISGSFDVTSVDIGIEDAIAGTGGAGSTVRSISPRKPGTGKTSGQAPTGGLQPLTVNLYTSSATFPTGFPGSLTLIGTASVMVSDQSSTILNIPVFGTAAAGSELVVEVFTPDGNKAGNLFFIGSNTAAETGPSYLSAADCGVPNPTPVAALGFPNMHIVMNVNGCAQPQAAGQTCTFTVTVNDTQPPTITCPANVTQSNDTNQCGAVVNYPSPTASDNCPGVGAPTCAPASGSFFPVGTTTVTCNVSDASGNTASCSFTVTVNDTQPPTITCPANQTIIADQTACTVGGGCVVATFADPTATDNCPGVTVACNPPSGSCFPVGVTTVTCTATDASGNTATCSFTVTAFDVALQDDSDPTIVLLWNSITGQYRFCCKGVVYTGVGKSTIQGCVFTLQHNPADRRVLGRVDKAVHAGSASIQSPAGTIRCTITDRNTLNDTPSCQ
jgi:hypothetical protein